MESSFIYPFFSFFSFIWISFALNKPIRIRKYYSIFFFFVLSSLWCCLLGYNGSDMVHYLDYFRDLRFDNLGFYGSPLEFTVGLFPALLRHIFSISDPYLLMTFHRLFTFSFIPTLILLFVKNKSFFNEFLSCFITFLSLLPYTFLSGANIILNGFSLSMISYAFLLILSLTISTNNGFCPQFNLKRYVIISILLFLAFFAHGYGTGSIILLTMCFSLICILLKLRLLTFKRKFLSFLLITLFFLPFCFLVSIKLSSLLTSKLFDNTLLLSSLILLLLILLSRSMFNLQSPNSYFDSKYIKYRSYINLLWSLLFCLSISSIFLGILGGGDAAERFIAGSINLNILFYVYYGVQFRNNLSLRSANISSRNCNLPVPFLNACFLSIIFVMNTYFYSSQAFFLNL